PYDVLTQADKDALLSRDGRNIVAVDLPHCPPSDVGPDSAYEQAAETLTQWRSSGVLVREQRDSLYAYQQSFTWAGRTHRRRSIIAAVRLEPFGSGVWPHEKTFAGPKADRLKLRQAARTQLSPILGFCDAGAASELLFDPLADRPDAAGDVDGVTSSLWTVSDPAVIGQVQTALAGVDLFIADGHHRYTTALNYRDALGEIAPDHPANFIMFVLVAADDPGLIVLPTHRVISGLQGFDPARFVAAAGAVADFQPVDLAGEDVTDADAFLKRFGPHAMAFAAGADAWVARVTDLTAMERLAPTESPAWRGLDVAILHRLLLDEYLADCRCDRTTTEYTADGPAALEAARTGRADLVALLQGAPLSAVREIALAGGVMPHKSTYFYPKAATGMVLYPLE
ncbi:hypothetical protein LCGC14_1879750, partial [marine sediment metagenome]